MIPSGREHSAASPAALNADGGPRDELYWLAKLHEDIPKASIVPDFRRSMTGRKVYRTADFEIDSETVQVLRSIDRTRGVSDAQLCASVLALLLAKYHRSDELIIGFQTEDGARPRSVVPLRIVCDRDATVAELVRALADEIAEVQERTAEALVDIPRLLGLEETGHRYPLFDLAVAVGGADAAIDLDRYPVDIGFVFRVAAGRIRGRAHYAAELYEEATVARVIAHYESVARQAAREPHRRIRQIEALGPEERDQILHQFNRRTAAFPLKDTLHGLFEGRVRRSPEAVAAVDRDTRWNYDELNRRANRLAHSLLALGLKRGDFVGLLLDRGCHFAAAMLGVFKAGGAYVPLDPTYPRDRIEYMLGDSRVAFLVSSAGVIDRFGELLASQKDLGVLVSIDAKVPDDTRAKLTGQAAVLGPEELRAAPEGNPGLPFNGRDRAYMIYTSGSTGRPKGAICRHDGALNHLFAELDGLGIDSPFSFLQSAASSSDISVWQFMAPLLSGGATVIVDHEVVIDPPRLFAAIRDEKTTVVELVPVVLRALLDHIAGLPELDRRLVAVRRMMSTGDALPTELVNRWLSHYPEIPIANTYGPTETSDDVSLVVMREPLSDQRAAAPIGYPLANVRLFVLDRDLQPVPIGVPGEICVGGIGVGEGYWNQPEKTQAAFVPCPFPDLAPGAMYRTGDLGRWLPDGAIEFLGRIDQQVKIRGFRVEPGEVEAAMTRHPAVKDAAVVAVKDKAGDTRLVGFFVPRDDQPVTPGELRQFLRAALADQMMPAAVVPLTALPLTPLGKLDRKALAKAEHLGASDSAQFVAPTTRLEGMVAAAWGSALGREQIGRLDNFFEMGGDSVLVLHAIAELREAGVAVAPKAFFLHPTVAELATYLESMPAAPARAAAAPATEADKLIEALREPLQASAYPDLEDLYALSATQRGIYFQSLLAPKRSGAYIEQVLFDLKGDLDEVAFGMAWQNTVNETDVLRTAVIRRGTPNPLQVVLRSALLAPDIRDWRKLPAPAREAAFDALCVEERVRGFDLKSPPLMRLILVRVSERHWHVLWTYHHVILDGWSEPLVLGAVFRAYQSITEGRQPEPAPGARYRGFVRWAEAQDVSSAETYWRRQLSGFVAPVSIKDNSPAVEPPSSVGVAHGWAGMELSDQEVETLDQLARRSQVTLSTIIHGAWALLLHQRTSALDVLFGSVASGRQNGPPGVEGIRGLLVVTQPLRSRFAREVGVAAWLRLLQVQMAEVREYAHAPLALVQQWCDVPVAKRPLFDSIVVLGNYAGSDLSKCGLPNLALDNVRYITQPLYALTLFVVTSPRLSIQLVYEKRKYAAETAKQLLAEYGQLLRRMAENPEQRLSSMVTVPAG